MEGMTRAITATYQEGRGDHLMGSVLNISLGGTYVSTANPLGKGIMTILTLEDSSRGNLVRIGGVVVRSDESRGMALSFVDKDNGGIRSLIQGLKGRAYVESPEDRPWESRQYQRIELLSNDFQMSKRTMRDHADGDHVKKEKRRNSRKLLRIEARYQDPESRVLKGVLRNISLSGLFIETAHPLALNTRLHLSLDATDLGKVIDVAGKVVRVEEKKGMGVEFDDKNNREIRLLLSSLRKLDQASMLALIRSGLGD